MNLTKIVFLIFTIFFSTLSFGDSITDFDMKMGGLTLGKDLNDYMSSEEIQRGRKGLENLYSHLQEPKKFLSIQVVNHPILNKKYRSIDINYMEIEDKLVVHAITIGEEKSFSACKRDGMKMFDKLSQKFPNLKVINTDFTHPADKSGESKGVIAVFTDKANNTAQIICTDWSEKLTKVNGWTDGFRFSLQTKLFKLWADGS